MCIRDRNTIVNKNGRLEGHNTDFAGFTCLLRRNGISLRGKTVMLLGTGGTQKTVLAVARACLLYTSRREW